MKKKSSSVKKIILNNIFYNKGLKDKKILEIYENFEKNFKKLNIQNKVAISVSGGPDSMALCFLISCYKLKNNNEIHPFFFMIDHGLRKSSAEEAKKVQKKLKLNNLNLKIIKWKGKKPKSNIQSIARQKRYELLFNECKKHNIKTLLTAHHQDDIYETFFIRLLRGSGTEGLSSFIETKRNFIYKKKFIAIVRPLLSFKKKDLTYISDKFFSFYVKDPSNEMDKYQRVRLRKLISNLKIQGLNFSKLYLTLKNLANSNKAINELVKDNIAKNVNFINKKYFLETDFFLLPDEIVFRSLSNLIKKIGKKTYPPRGKKIINLINELKTKDQFKATLGGTIVEKIRNSVVVKVEKTQKR